MSTPDRTRIQCNCKVCNGRQAGVPAAVLTNLKSKRTAYHNLVCLAWSNYAPANVRRIG